MFFEYLLEESPNPEMMFHSKKRGNTTIKFMDGSSITVKKAKGEKDSLETAVAYILAYKLMRGKGNFNRLVKMIKEVD